MLRATAHLPAGHGRGTPFDLVVLAHDERRLRRKLLTLAQGDEVLVDFRETVTLDHRGALVLEDGRLVEVVAAEERLHEVRGRDHEHLMRLAWHIGNRHTPAQLESGRILIQRDHVLKNMLEGLGAAVSDVTEPFSPEHGAYHSHSHGHADAGHALLYRK
ncbi:urease accessory protein UreE [Devosia geojensis]|uniref:Urease accessory protein UreE n=1 Tax=Devosia geojensis TaxID=443610 RepID=A0A0F5FXB3_9HYPH|nr:urease accessory protein UreE [Devosia geojensis]KKB12822.1 urease accessory protein UreE [Devosia geojensis]